MQARALEEKIEKERSRVRSLEEEIKKHVKNVDELKVLASIHVPPRFPVANAARRA